VPQAFFVVGHEKWGKSTTLAALANLGPHGKKFYCDSRRFEVRHMSNDDKPESWQKFVENLDASVYSHVIIALCPKPDVQLLLRNLRRKYDLFFWIIQRSHNGYPHSRGDDGRVISLDEEQVLRSLGTVEVFTQLADHSDRATAFENFIRTHR